MGAETADGSGGLVFSELRYRRLFEAAQDGILILDFESRKIIDANSFIAQLLGYTKEELVSLELWEIGLLGDEEASREAFRVLQDEGEIRYENLPLKSKDGATHQVEFVSNVYEEGASRVIQCNIRDITERVEASRQIREGEERYRWIVNSIKEYAIFSADVEGKIDSWNEGAERVFGFAEAEILGKPIDTIYTPEDREAGRPQYEMKMALGHEAVEDVRWHLRSGGARVFVSGRVMLIRDGEGNPRGFTKVARDITKEREAESRKDEFLAMLSHELRNPLSSIGNAVTLMRMPGVSRETTDWSSEVIDRQVRHLARLIDDLTDVSRLTRGLFTLRKIRLDFAEVLRRSIETSRVLFEDKSQGFEFTGSQDPLWYEGDGTRLEQVFTNLLANSSRYTPVGGLIRMTLTSEGEIKVTVADNGIGIEASRLKEVFELFIQGACTLDRREGGLGVGLTIIRRITELHGGVVFAHSEGLGKGSEFTVILPFLDPASVVVEGEPVLKTLVVDDNVDSAKALSKLMSLLGHSVQVCHDGAEAVERALSFKPDLILLDIGLPLLNGYEVAGRLRGEGMKSMIIAVTGYNQEEDRRKSRDAGFDHHLVKPLNYGALTAIVGALVPMAS